MFKGSLETNDLNTCTTVGVYTSQNLSAVSNVPTDISGLNHAGFLIVCAYSTLRSQILIDTDTGKVYARYSSSSAWITADVPSFYKDYSTLALLAEAVITTEFSTEHTYFNLDSYKQGATYCGNISNLGGDVPTALIDGSSVQGGIICFGTGASRAIQVCITKLGIGTRFFDGSSWTAWKTVLFS